MSTLEYIFFFLLFKHLRYSIFRSFITERKSSPEMFIQCSLMKTVPGIRLRTFENNICPGTDEVFQLQCWLVPFLGTLQSCHTWELSLAFILWNGLTRSTVFELCWLPLLLPLFSIMSGMVALGIPRGLWTAAVMVTLMVSLAENI